MHLFIYLWWNNEFFALSLVLSFESPGIDVGEYQAIVIYVPPFVLLIYLSCNFIFFIGTWKWHCSYIVTSICCFFLTYKGPLFIVNVCMPMGMCGAVRTAFRILFYCMVGNLDCKCLYLLNHLTSSVTCLFWDGICCLVWPPRNELTWFLFFLSSWSYRWAP